MLKTRNWKSKPRNQENENRSEILSRKKKKKKLWEVLNMRNQGGRRRLSKIKKKILEMKMNELNWIKYERNIKRK